MCEQSKFPHLEQTAKLCQALRGIHPAGSNREKIETLLGGDVVLDSLTEVAFVLGQSANTIKNSWRSVGMPGEQGAYHLAAILSWRFRYESEWRGRGVPTENEENLVNSVDTRLGEIIERRLASFERALKKQLQPA